MSSKRKILRRYSSTEMKKPKIKRKPAKKKKRRAPKKVYTYILHDIELDIFKIGKSQVPINRLRNLCRRGKVLPVALAHEDIEEKLHKEFSANRTTHPDYKDNGGTEWFKRGGKFDDFIEGVKKEYYLPFITMHVMVEDMIENGSIVINDPSTQWEIAQSKFSYYLIGREILEALKVLVNTKKELTSKYYKHILIIGNKVAVSEELIDRISKKYIFYCAVDRSSPILIKEKKEGSRLRKIAIEREAFDSDIYLLINKK